MIVTDKKKNLSDNELDMVSGGLQAPTDDVRVRKGPGGGNGAHRDAYPGQNIYTEHNNDGKEMWTF